MRAAAAPFTITTFDAPGAGKNSWLASLSVEAKGPPTQGTGGISINTGGAIAGTYADTSTVYHGFVRAANGKITTFSVPGAGTAALQGSVGISINASGDIVGAYLDANNVFHGFLRNPK